MLIKYPTKIILLIIKNSEKKGAKRGVANHETTEIPIPHEIKIGSDKAIKKSCNSRIIPQRDRCGYNFSIDRMFFLFN